MPKVCLSVNASVPCSGTRNPLENVISGKDEVWQRPRRGAHEPFLRPLDPNKDIRSCSIWKAQAQDVEVEKSTRWSLLVPMKLKTTCKEKKRTPLCMAVLYTGAETQAAQLATSSSVLEVCKPTQCISPPTVMDCVHMHKKTAQAHYKTIVSKRKQP